MSKSVDESNPNKTKPPRAAPKGAPHGQLEVEPDYAPAMSAIGDLCTWALDLAARSVADWPEGRRRVKNASRHMRTLLQGKKPRGRGAEEDLMFTAALLARIFDADLGLGVGNGPLEERAVHQR